LPNAFISMGSARALLLLGVWESTNAMHVSVGVPSRPPVVRLGQPLAFEAGGGDSVKLVRDALMNRAVEQQISSFALVHDTARRTYLYDQWEKFLRRSQPDPPDQPPRPGTLTTFIGHLQRAEVTSIFVPRRMFRQLSPGNPYATSDEGGRHEEVHPTQIALSLISCREQLAEYWVELLPSLAQPPGGGGAAALPRTLDEVRRAQRERLSTDAAADAANATVADDRFDLYDKQLLLGIATKLAARAMLKDLSLRPSCSHLHDWLKSYLLVQHADDLTTRGSVQRLHASLVAQPVCIRGGALVDPADISLELFQRSVEILDFIEEDLRAAPEHIVPFTAGFLDSCLLL